MRSKARHRRHNTVALALQVCEVLVGLRVIHCYLLGCINYAADGSATECVIDDINLSRRNAVTLNNNAFGQGAHSQNTIRRKQRMLLNLVHKRVAVMLAGAVKLGGMHMHNQRRTS